MSDLISRESLKEYRIKQSSDMFEKGWNSAITAIYQTAKSATVKDGVIKPCVSAQACHEDKMKVLEKIRVEVKQKLEQEEFARSVFRHEEKDCTKANQCTGSIMAYRNVLKMFDKYMEESEV